jgi:hypothetical protein
MHHAVGHPLSASALRVRTFTEKIMRGLTRVGAKESRTRLRRLPDRASTINSELNYETATEGLHTIDNAAITKAIE